MGSKGSKTTTQNQVQNQTYTPNPLIAGAAGQAITGAQTAASAPFQTPAAPVAGFSPDQLAAFNTVNNTQGTAAPYYQQAANYANQSAAPINAGQIANYLNPYAQSVLGNLNETFAQQARNTTGQLTQAAGGVGADRIAVGQAELARQQGLAAGQTMSGIYQNALSAAQQDAQRQANAGYAFQAIGPGAQNAALQGAQAQLGTGGLQQQLQQAQLMSPYNQQLQQLAYPFQTNQYLAGITGGLAPALGGTTNSIGTTQTTAPQPSMLSQILGLGMAGLGAYNQFGGGSMGGGKGVTSTPNSPSASIFAPQDPNLNLAGFGPTYFSARGGAITKDDGGSVDSMPSVVPDIPLHPGPYPQFHPMNMPEAAGGGGGGGGSGGGSDTLGKVAAIAGTVAKFLPLILAKDGGKIDKVYPTEKYDDGPTYDQKTRNVLNPELPSVDVLQEKMNRLGNTNDPRGSIERSPLNISVGGTVMPQAMGQGFADGGLTQDAFDDRFPQAGSINSGAMAMANPVGVAQALKLNAPGVAPPSANPFASMPPVSNVPLKTQSGQMPGNALPFAGSPGGPGVPGGGGSFAPPIPTAPANPAPSMPDSELPYPGALDDQSSQFARSPWQALIAAGLATAASTSPYPLANIGKGGLEGLKVLEQQRKEAREEQSVNMRAKQMWQQMQEHLDQYNKVPLGTQQQQEEAHRHNVEIEKQGQEKIEQDQWAPTGTLSNGYPVYINKKTGKFKVFSPEQAPGQPTAPEPERTNSTIAPQGGGIVVNDTPDNMVGPAVTTASPNPAVRGMYPTTQAMSSGLVEARQEEFRFNQQVQAADISRQRVASMRHSFDVIANFAATHPNDKKLNALLQPGTTGEQRQAILNAWASVPGNKAPQEVVAAINSLGKDAILGGFSNITATGLSAREAQPIIRAGMSAMPSFSLPEQSSRALLAMMEAQSDKIMDEKKFMDNYKMQNNGLLTGWREAFDKVNPPEKYAAQAIYSQLPAEKKQALPGHVQELRQSRDAVLAAEKSGDAEAAKAAREHYAVVKRGFDHEYSALGNYFAFGRF